MKEFFITIGKWFIKAMLYLEGTTMLTLEAGKVLLTPPLKLRPAIDQIEYIGIKSMLIALITALFTGAVMALQMAFA
ncbi:MAG: ABC transporter permease, partial [Deltaproteobacteria bacterium]